MLRRKPIAATASIQPQQAPIRGKIPIAPAAPPSHTSRDFVPWRFLDAGRKSAWIVSASRRPKTCRIGDIPGLAWYACCKDDCEGRDSRLLLNGEPLQLGQTRRIGFVFLSPDSAAIFKSAGNYLWEGRIIGEAVVQR